jgi:hypothetical protein
VNPTWKRLVVLLLVAAGALPAWPAKKISVQDLKDLLAAMQQKKKNDADVATALKQVELSEELTRAGMNSLLSYEPGQQTTEQIYVLEGRSAMLAPPAADIPSAAAPDSAAQNAILNKAAEYVTKTYAELPALAAMKTALRFQDNVETVAAASGIQGGATEVDVSPRFSNPASFVHYINSSQVQVAFEHGGEKAPAKDKIPWGANSMITLEQPEPSLAVIFQEAQSSGSLKWLRWELIDGRQMAVFAFAVPRKKSRLEVAVCCFPNVNQAGIATFYTATTAPALSGGTSTGGGGVAGNFQTNTEWHDYKSMAAYHGELFIDPETGLVVRMITQAELKPSEVVHQEDTRVDFGPVPVSGKMLMVPVKAFVDTEVVPNGDSSAGRYTTRRTLFITEYKDYRPSMALQ